MFHNVTLVCVPSLSLGPDAGYLTAMSTN